LAGGQVDQTELDRIREEIDYEIESAVERAKTAPQPALDDLLTDVYAGGEPV
jgi:TPP-dependent pyruvate/acetoin dehydrogenase alpha subunit